MLVSKLALYLLPCELTTTTKNTKTLLTFYMTPCVSVVSTDVQKYTNTE